MYNNNNNNNLIFLSDVINLEQDIEPYNLIQIRAGVGSGKNYWVQKLAEQGKSILFITSRKITADVQNDNIKGIEIDIENWYRHTFDGMVVGNNQYLVSRTNAWIAYFAKNVYDPDNVKTYIWRYFDYIFLDEAHSVATDATFADASFHVWRFLSWAVLQKLKDEKTKCKVILMSATPEPLEKLILKKTKGKEWFHSIDYFDKCNHIDPKRVIIRHENSTKEAAKVIKKYFEKEQKIIYFTSGIEHIIQLIDDLAQQGISETSIGVAFTDEKKLDKFSPEMLEKRERIDKLLKTEEVLPDDVKIFITTTKCKEGINIRNDDIKIMFAESSQKLELIQMAGRVRNGLDELNVMYKLSRSYNNTKLDQWRRHLSKNSIRRITNDYDYFCKKNKKLFMPDIIDDIQNSFPYVRYDLFQQKFLFFEGKKIGEDLSIKGKSKLLRWIKRWDDEIDPGKEDFQEWFPYSIVELADAEPTDKEIEKAIIVQYLKELKLIEKPISKTARDDIFKALNDILSQKLPGVSSQVKYTFFRQKVHTFEEGISPQECQFSQ